MHLRNGSAGKFCGCYLTIMCNGVEQFISCPPHLYGDVRSYETLKRCSKKRFCLAPKIPYQHSPLVSRNHEESFWILLMEAFVWGAERRTLQRERGCSILLLDIPSSEKRATLFRFDQRTRGNSQLLSSGEKKKKKKDSCLKIIHLSWDKSFRVWFFFCGLTLSKLGAWANDNVPVYGLYSSLQRSFRNVICTNYNTPSGTYCVNEMCRKQIQHGEAKPLWKCTLDGWFHRQSLHLMLKGITALW